VFGAALQAEEKAALLIAAASDLKFALDEAVVVFRKDQDMQVKVTYGSSGSLFAQIDNGAPFDLFLSADAKFPRLLINNGKAEKESLFQYARGHLVLWVPHSSRLDIDGSGLKSLFDASVRKIAIANPDVAPYGTAAVAAMKSAGVYGAVRGKLVLGENVAQAAQFIESGAAEAGIIALSLALAPNLKDKGRFWEVPPDTFPPLEQAGVIRSGSAQREAATKLREFLMSEAGREVLRRYGFLLPDDNR